MDDPREDFNEIARQENDVLPGEDMQEEVPNEDPRPELRAEGIRQLE